MNRVPTVPLVDLNAQHAAIRDELDQAIRRVLDAGQFVLGPEVEAFEQELAEFCGVAYAVGVSSGLAALRLSLLAAGIGPGDEVITAANTFAATVLAICQVGATPRLVDVDPETATLDPAQLEQAITNRTRAVIPVHLYGQSADMAAILDIANRHGVVVMEDAAQAHGALFKGRPAGSFGLAGCFSFYPTKNIGALGDCGAIVTDDHRLAEQVRMLRNYGKRDKNHFDVIGSNERLDTLQAAVLRVKLPRVAEWNERRRQHAARYRAGLGGLPLKLPIEGRSRRHVYHLFVVETPQREALAEHLFRHGIMTGVHYPVPPARQAAFRDEPFAGRSFPVTDRMAAECLSLPMYPHLETSQIDHVIQAVREFFD